MFAQLVGTLIVWLGPSPKLTRLPKRTRTFRPKVEALEDRTLLTATLVKDINPGQASSSPEYLTDVNGKLFFVTTNAQNQRVLWMTNGTEAGTKEVRDTQGNLIIGDPWNLTNINGVLYFSFSDAARGNELWKVIATGGQPTADIVADIVPGAGGSSPTNMTYFNGKCYFQATDHRGSELWVTDGTANGTQIVRDINPNGNSGAGLFTPVGTSLYFVAYEPVNGSEVWVTDGTQANTQIAVDVNQVPGQGSNPLRLTNVSGKLYFVATDGVIGRELRRYDGPGTTLFSYDIVQGAMGSDPMDLTAVGTSVFFSASTPGIGREPFRHDVGLGQAIPIGFDIWPGNDTSFPDFLTNVGGTLYFGASDGTPVLFGGHGNEVWKASPGGAPQRVTDLNPNGDSLPSNFTLGADAVYFSATDGGGPGQKGAEVWFLGPVGNAFLVRDIYEGQGPSGPTRLTRSSDGVNTIVYFVAHNGPQNQLGDELWRTITLIATNTSIFSAPNPSTVGQLVSITAIVSAAAPDPGIPTGTVTFFIDGAAQSTQFVNPSGMATYSTTFMSVGDHEVYAVYNGSVDFDVSTSPTIIQVVNAWGGPGGPGGGGGAFSAESGAGEGGGFVSFESVLEYLEEKKLDFADKGKYISWLSLATTVLVSLASQKDVNWTANMLVEQTLVVVDDLMANMGDDWDSIAPTEETESDLLLVWESTLGEFDWEEE